MGRVICPSTALLSPSSLSNREMEKMAGPEKRGFSRHYCKKIWKTAAYLKLYAFGDIHDIPFLISVYANETDRTKIASISAHKIHWLQAMHYYLGHDKHKEK